MNSDNRQLAPLAFLWPALAAGSASEFASAMAREFANLVVGPDTQAGGAPPRWTTRNKVPLELPAVRLRDFSRSRDGGATLICAPFALHGATLVDFALQHSLIAGRPTRRSVAGLRVGPDDEVREFPRHGRRELARGASRERGPEKRKRSKVSVA